MNTNAKIFYLASSLTFLGTIPCLVVVNYSFRKFFELGSVPISGDGSGRAVIIVGFLCLTLVAFMAGAFQALCGVGFYLAGLWQERKN